MENTINATENQNQYDEFTEYQGDGVTWSDLFFFCNIPEIIKYLEQYSLLKYQASINGKNVIVYPKVDLRKVFRENRKDIDSLVSTITNTSINDIALMSIDSIIDVLDYIRECFSRTIYGILPKYKFVEWYSHLLNSYNKNPIFNSNESSKYELNKEDLDYGRLIGYNSHVQINKFIYTFLNIIDRINNSDDMFCDFDAFIHYIILLQSLGINNRDIVFESDKCIQQKIKTVSCVYFIHNDLNGYTKIGCTTDICRRFKEIQSTIKNYQCLPPCLSMLRIIITGNNPEILEDDLHKQFAKYRIDGEWFNIPDDYLLLNDIQHICKHDNVSIDMLCREEDTSNKLYAQIKSMNFNIISNAIEKDNTSIFPADLFLNIRQTWNDIYDYMSFWCTEIDFSEQIKRIIYKGIIPAIGTCLDKINKETNLFYQEYYVCFGEEARMLLMSGHIAVSSYYDIEKKEICYVFVKTNLNT